MGHSEGWLIYPKSSEFKARHWARCSAGSHQGEAILVKFPEKEEGGAWLKGSPSSSVKRGYSKGWHGGTLQLGVFPVHRGDHPALLTACRRRCRWPGARPLTALQEPERDSPDTAPRLSHLNQAPQTSALLPGDCGTTWMAGRSPLRRLPRCPDLSTAGARPRLHGEGRGTLWAH